MDVIETIEVAVGSPAAELVWLDVATGEIVGPWAQRTLLAQMRRALARKEGLAAKSAAAGSAASRQGIVRSTRSSRMNETGRAA
jgi:hypothetical protein